MNPRASLPARLRAAALLLALPALPGWADTPPQALDAPATPLVRTGQGGPTIVLQYGLGDDRRTWKKIFEPLGAQHQVVALERPGHGGLPPTDSARDPCTIARESREQLRAAGIPPPYLLIGHSLGGRYQYAFARLYPQDVAGLLLLDPTPPGHWARLQSETPHLALLLKGLRAVAFSATDKAEFDAQDVCMDSLIQGPPLALPARVLVPGRFRPEEKGDFETMQKRARQQWKTLLGLERLEVIWDAGHFIHQDSPDEVLARLPAPGPAEAP